MVEKGNDGCGTGAPEGYADHITLDDNSVDSDPREMANKLLAKSGPVAETIGTYCDGLGLESDNPQRIALELAGILVGAFGRRGSRKGKAAAKKELIAHEWAGAMRIRNFVISMARALGNLNDVVEEAKTVRPEWGEIKPEVIVRLNEQGIDSLSDQVSWNEAKRQITLAKYRRLEDNLVAVTAMVYFTGRRLGIPNDQLVKLTDRILDEHYPVLPEYNETSVDNRNPLAYEMKCLNVWKALILEPGEHLS